MNNQLVIIGAGGHGRVVSDIAKEKYRNIIFLDDDSTINFVSGPISDFKKYINDSDFFVAIGNNTIRYNVLKEIKNSGASIVSIISSTASIASNVEIEEGTVVMNQAVINNGCVIKSGVIVNTYSSIDHDCYIDECCHIAINAHLAGTVKLGKKVFIGAGATVINNIDICDEVIIGAGATVVSNIVEEGTYIGTPAKRK